MKEVLCLLFLLSMYYGSSAQDSTLFFSEIHRKSPDDESDWQYTIHDSLLIKIDQNRTRYRLFNRKDRMLVECQITSAIHNNLVRSGKWKSYNNSGMKVAEGCYDNDMKVGLWCYYNERGELRRRENMTKVEMPGGGYHSLETGPFEDYDEQGKLKLTGFYKIKQSNGTDTMKMILHETGELVMVLMKSAFPINSFPSGVWTYYNADGSIMRREEYTD